MASYRVSFASCVHPALKTTYQRNSTSALRAGLARRATGAAPSASRAQSTSVPGGRVTMPWDDYFKLRKSRRTWGTIAAIPTTLAGVMVGGGYFANLQSDPNQLILGFEPIIVYGVAVVGCVGIGWLSGPMFGTAIWRLSHRSILPKMEQMDTIFFNHIKRKRVDPSRQSVNNPTPDYFGEGVNSKKQYRQWLRDQATFRRKATFGSVKEEL